MASIEKRGSKYRAFIYCDGARKSKTFDKKTDAMKWARAKEHELSSMEEGVHPTMSLRELWVRYADEISPKKDSEEWEIARLKQFERTNLSSIKLLDLRREHLEEYIESRMKTVKGSTVNRELNLISNTLRYARRWRYMKHEPMKDIDRPKNPPHRWRRITDEEIDLICTALNYDDDLPIQMKTQEVAVAFLIAIETAMRKSEILTLKAEQVDLENRVVALYKTKNGHPRKVPLSKRAVLLFQKIMNAGMFSITPESCDTLFRKYRNKMGIDDLHFHDTRHEATTRLAQKLQVLDLARVTGHKDIKQLMTYYNKDAEELADLLDED